MLLEAFSLPPLLSGINDVTAGNNDVLQLNQSVTSPIAHMEEISINAIRSQGQGQRQGIGAVSIPKVLTMNSKFDAIPPVSQQALLKMAFTTAQGIHDAVCTYHTCFL